MPAPKKAATPKLEVVFDEPIPKRNVVRFNTSQDAPAISSVYLSNDAHKLLKQPGKIKITVEAL